MNTNTDIFISNQFDDELNLNPPDPNKEYWISPLVKDKGLTLLMKLVLISRKHPEFLNDVSSKPEKYKDAIDKQTEKGCTALMIACRNCKTESSEEAIRLLLETKADVNIQTEKGWTALMMSCRYCNTDSSEETIRLLLSKGANVNIQENDSWTALMMASRYCKTTSSEETIRLLLKAKANVDIQNNDRWTALMMTCRYCKTESSEEAIRLLLEAKANVNLQEKDGWTALMMACRFCNTDSSEETIRLLLSKGANVDIQNKNSLTALMLVLDYSKNKNIIKLIEEKCKGIIIPENNIYDKDLIIKLYKLKTQKQENRIKELQKIKRILTNTDIMNSKVLQYI